VPAVSDPAEHQGSVQPWPCLGEQVLRVIGRIDEAGKKNAFLSNVKLKSYKTASGLLDRMKKLSADKVCP